MMSSRILSLPRLIAFAALVLCSAILPLRAAAKKAPKPGHPARIPASAPVSDSVTVGLWHFDERGGTHCTDSSPFRNYGTSGPEARVEFGRYKNARGFVATTQSFVFVPYNPVMESPRGFTVEAWVYLNDYSRYELSGIAMRWTPVPNQQSWLLGVVGDKLPPGATTTPSPGTFNAEVTGIPTGRLVFAFSPELAAGTQSFASTSTFPLRRWVHVAASVDGEIVRMYINGRLDVQVAIANQIRRSDAPLIVGNVIDPRRLTDFASDLRQDPNNLPLPWYALNGTVDELRISNVARQVFESADLR